MPTHDESRGEWSRPATGSRGQQPTPPRAVELFSTPLEIGLRALFVLAALPGPVDLQRLVVLDYLLVHSGDAGGPTSLHPATPHRGGEILVKRDLLQHGIRLMMSRDLAAMDLDADGIQYRATDLTIPFLAYLDGAYVDQLRARASWVTAAFGSTDEATLRLYVADHLDQWGGEFVTEAAVRDVAV
ncbi:MAG: ABC-three component system middle component 2 [Gemmatimonadaceae bacterium]